MYSDRIRRHWFAWAALPLLLAVLFWGFFTLRESGNLREEGAVALQEAVKRCALQCYVVEGVYPPSLAYLEEHYGLQVNREDYYVVYEIFASNIPPEVQVLNRK